MVRFRRNADPQARTDTKSTSYQAGANPVQTLAPTSMLRACRRMRAVVKRTENELGGLEPRVAPGKHNRHLQQWGLGGSFPAST